MAAQDREPKRTGRPPVGPPIHVRMPTDLLAWVDGKVPAGGTRAATVRELLEHLRAQEEGRRHG